MSVGPVPGIEPATSRSAVKRSTHWANPTAVFGRPKKYDHDLLYQLNKMYSTSFTTSEFFLDISTV